MLDIAHYTLCHRPPADLAKATRSRAQWGQRFKSLALMLGAAVSVAIVVGLPLKQWSPPPVSMSDAALLDLDERVDVTFGGQFRLLGYAMARDPLAVTLTLYWEAIVTPDFDYSVFVHLLNQEEQLVGQDDHAPGAAYGHPPTNWAAGDIIRDEYRIALSAATDEGLGFRIGVYNWSSGERLPVQIAGVETGDFYQVASAPPMSTALTKIALAIGAILLLCGIGVWMYRRRSSPK